MPLWLGIDIGGTKLGLALGDDTGAIRARQRRPAALTGRAVDDVAAIAADAKGLLARAPEPVAGVGVAVPGPMDPERGLVLDPPNLAGWEEVPIREQLADALGLPVWIENDANAAALAEWRFGAGRGAQHVVYLTMSTGIGAGLVLGGRLHRGQAFGAGEVGHIPLLDDGPTCGCGLRGCFEALCGGASWTRRLREVTPPESRAATLAGGPDAVRPEHVVEAARAGDAFARAELDRFNQHLARAIVTLGFILAPEVVVLGTIPTAAGDALCLDPVRERVRARLWPLLARGLAIEPSALGEALPDYAGLCVALEGSAGAS